MAELRNGALGREGGVVGIVLLGLSLDNGAIRASGFPHESRRLMITSRHNALTERRSAPPEATL